MLRRLAIFLLTLSLCWQALVAAGVGVVMADAHEQAHELLHFEGTAHHHDDHDRHGDSNAGDEVAKGFHEDGSLSSATHMAHDAGQFSPALMFAPVLSLASLAPVRPSVVAQSARPLNCLDGLERPPRLTA